MWNEQANGTQWTLNLSEVDRIEMMAQIVVFEFVVEKIEAKFKLNQNRSTADRAGVVNGLKERGSPAQLELSRWMSTK